MSNGYACIGLHHPKNRINVGAALRAAGCFDAALVVTSGKRYTQSITDVSVAHKRIPLLQVSSVIESIPYDCVPVAIEVCEDAIDLPVYEHPKRAFYIFGPEDGTLGASVVQRCRDVVRIPAGCLNLAACVNVVLYDRLAKEKR